MTEQNYRPAVDPFLIVHFVQTQDDASVADLGTGNGIIPTLLNKRFPRQTITGFELQKNLIFEAGAAVKKSKLSGRIQLVCCDLRDHKKLIKASTFNMAVGNPPYRRSNDGRINKNKSHAIARHELTITLREYIAACSHLVMDGGKISLIYHPYRMAELLVVMQEMKIAPSRLRFVHSRRNEEACMFLVEGIRKGKNDLVVEKPFYIYKSEGSYSDEMAEIYTLSGFPPKKGHRK